MCSSFFSFFFLRVSTNKNSKGSTVTKASFYLNLFERGQENKIKNSFPAVSHPVSPLDQRLKKKNLNNKRLKTIIFILNAPVSPGFSRKFQTIFTWTSPRENENVFDGYGWNARPAGFYRMPCNSFPLKKNVFIELCEETSARIRWYGRTGGGGNAMKKKKKKKLQR